jgi:hypothetical protein
MPGGFTWADFFAGYQAAGRGFFEVGGTIAGVVVALVLAALFAMWLDDKLGPERKASEAIRAEARARHPHGGSVQPTEDFGFDDIYSERKAS